MTGKTEGIRFKTQKSKRDAAKLHFTENQADANLEMKLYRLIGLELDSLQADYDRTMKNIAEYTDILSNYSSMARVITDELQSYRKNYAQGRLTDITNQEAVDLEERKAEAYPCVFLMDRFGYARTVDEAVYEKNREAADSENKVVLHCMSDGKLCIYTDLGKQHILKVGDVPHGKFRDKGTPIDNLCNYDSKDELFIAVLPLTDIVNMKLIFVTEGGLIKQVEGSEFDVSKKTVAATKLDEGDRLLSVHIVHIQTTMVLHTANNYMLRLSEDDAPLLKKNARGVRGITLGDEDKVEDVWYLEEGAPTEVVINEKTVALNRLKISVRGTKGTRLRK